MAKKPLLSPEELRQLLRYDPETGKLYWLERGPEWFPEYDRERCWRRWNTRWSGREAFTSRNGCGYFTGSLLDQPHRAHRVAWAIYHGAWPQGEIDHINGDRSDNRIENLRDVPKLVNSMNAARPAHNTSGSVGVHWYKKNNKWSAAITVEQRQIHLGYFANKDDAIAARRSAEERYGFHANHGR